MAKALIGHLASDLRTSARSHHRQPSAPHTCRPSSRPWSSGCRPRTTSSMLRLPAARGRRTSSDPRTLRSPDPAAESGVRPASLPPRLRLLVSPAIAPRDRLPDAAGHRASAGWSASSWITNLGDGLMLAAGPLLVASQTRNPLARRRRRDRAPAALAALRALRGSDRRPPRPAADHDGDGRRPRRGAGRALRRDRHRARQHRRSCCAMFLALGTAEVFADPTSGTLLPMLVDKRDLGIANARIMAGFLTANQLVGPAVGALLFTAGDRAAVHAPRPSSWRVGVVLDLAHRYAAGRRARATSTPTSGRTSPRACAGWSATLRSARSR